MLLSLEKATSYSKLQPLIRKAFQCRMVEQFRPQKQQCVQRLVMFPWTRKQRASRDRNQAREEGKCALA